MHCVRLNRWQIHVPILTPVTSESLCRHCSIYDLNPKLYFGMTSAYSREGDGYRHTDRDPLPIVEKLLYSLEGEHLCIPLTALLSSDGEDRRCPLPDHGR